MSVQSLISRAQQANNFYAFSLRLNCQHIAIRLAAGHPKREFRLDQLRSCGILGKTNRDPRWRSRIMQELAKAGIFERVGYEESCCPGRGSRPMMVWRLTNNIVRILDWVDSHPIQNSETSQTMLFD